MKNFKLSHTHTTPSLPLSRYTLSNATHIHSIYFSPFLSLSRSNTLFKKAPPISHLSFYSPILNYLQTLLHIQLSHSIHVHVTNKKLTHFKTLPLYITHILKLPLYLSVFVYLSFSLTSNSLSFSLSLSLPLSVVFCLSLFLSYTKYILMRALTVSLSLSHSQINVDIKTTEMWERENVSLQLGRNVRQVSAYLMIRKNF